VLHETEAEEESFFRADGRYRVDASEEATSRYKNWHTGLGQWTDNWMRGTARVAARAAGRHDSGPGEAVAVDSLEIWETMLNQSTYFHSTYAMMLCSRREAYLIMDKTAQPTEARALPATQGHCTRGTN
jgi:hypothetical protein